jgi:hypothetical protein
MVMLPHISVLGEHCTRLGGSGITRKIEVHDPFLRRAKY